MSLAPRLPGSGVRHADLDAAVLAVLRADPGREHDPRALCEALRLDPTNDARRERVRASLRRLRESGLVQGRKLSGAECLQLPGHERGAVNVVVYRIAAARKGRAA